MDASIDFAIGNGIGRDKTALKRALIERYAPRYFRPGIGLAIPANGSAFQFITDSPNSGRRLEVKRLHLDIAQPIVSNAPVTEPTTVTIYLVADPGNAVASISQFLHSASVIRRWTTLPIDYEWTSGSGMVYHPENLWIIATNVSGSAITLAGNIQLIDRAEDQWSDPTMIYDLYNAFNNIE